MKRIALLVVVCVAAMATLSPAAMIVQELFDGVPLDTTLNGQGDFTTTLGLSGTWLANGTYGNLIYSANNFDVDYSLPGPPYSAGSQGGLWYNSYTGSGAHWDTDIYMTRPLATAVDFSSSQTLYFSVRLNNSGDTAMGLGLAAGANGSAEFVGAGYTWNTAADPYGGAAGNSLYLSAGTLDQAFGGNNNGPYAILAHTAAGTQDGAGLMVARLTLSGAGADTVDVRNYHAGDTIDNDPSSVTWDLQGGADSSMSATHLLLWLNGSGQGEIDAIRIGTTWADVTGVPEPSVAGLAVFAGAILALRRRLGKK